MPRRERPPRSRCGHLADANALAAFRARYWLDRGLGGELLRGSAEAVPIISRGADLAPGNSKVALMLGRFHNRSYSTADAVEWFEDAVARDPSSPRVLDAEAKFHRRRGDEDRAAELQARLEALPAADDGRRVVTPSG